MRHSLIFCIAYDFLGVNMGYYLLLDAQPYTRIVFVNVIYIYVWQLPALPQNMLTPSLCSTLCCHLESDAI